MWNVQWDRRVNIHRGFLRITTKVHKIWVSSQVANIERWQPYLVWCLKYHQNDSQNWLTCPWTWFIFEFSLNERNTALSFRRESERWK